MQLEFQYFQFLNRIPLLLRRVKRPRRRGIIIMAGIVLVGVLSWFVIRYIQKQMVLSAMESPKTVNLENYQETKILKEINQLYTLGEDQDAVVGKIVDIKALARQHAFFKKGRNGDYLLIMPQFTLIYDRENKHVVDVARENLLDLKEGQQP